MPYVFFFLDVSPGERRGGVDGNGILVLMIAGIVLVFVASCAFTNMSLCTTSSGHRHPKSNLTPVGSVDFL